MYWQVNLAGKPTWDLDGELTLAAHIWDGYGRGRPDQGLPDERHLGVSLHRHLEWAACKAANGQKLTHLEI